eukprot:CAMPEP_0202952882 /NCGR_PEP_ID=MMETSP1395-20130829/41663_1 /ASSEMBLY_ACC=CAM_ASM_000871 /TAXON_ID=5961 /ORGANISM="Blepharisma japonicum, Strain Stock R1072" /LENGTH=50 /DNA_ID=CAMNT_0049664561 /DNA_START=121 /DNA_END=273 /DNA_ORIENTATION=+
MSRNFLGLTITLPQLNFSLKHAKKCTLGLLSLLTILWLSTAELAKAEQEL